MLFISSTSSYATRQKKKQQEEKENKEGATFAPVLAWEQEKHDMKNRWRWLLLL